MHAGPTADSTLDSTTAFFISKPHSAEATGGDAAWLPSAEATGGENEWHWPEQEDKYGGEQAEYKYGFEQAERGAEEAEYKYGVEQAAWAEYMYGSGSPQWQECSTRRSRRPSWSW